jgi:hypothetical protein
MEDSLLDRCQLKNDVRIRGLEFVQAHELAFGVAMKLSQEIGFDLPAELF